MSNVFICGRNILGRGKIKCKGAEVRVALACLTASRRLIWLERNEKKEISKRWGQSVGGGADCNDLDFHSE